MSLPADCSVLALPWETARLTIRAFAGEDFEDVYVLCSHAEICRYIRPPMSREQVETHIRERLRPWFFEERKWYSLAVCLPGERRVIGELVFRLESRPDRRAEIGYRFHPDAQGKGYAGEAVARLIAALFTVLDLHKLTAYCDAENQASNRLLARLGMREEGLLRAHYHHRDQWCDVIAYGLLAAEHPSRA